MSQPKKRITPTFVRELSDEKKSSKRKRADSGAFWEGGLEDAVGTSQRPDIARLNDNLNYWDAIHQKHARSRSAPGTVSPKRMGSEKIQAGKEEKYPFCCPYAETEGPDKGTCVLAYKLKEDVAQDVRCAHTHATGNIRRHLRECFHTQDDELKQKLDWVEFP